MTKRKRELTGTVEDLGNGKYKLRVLVGYYENGNPNRKSKNVAAKNLRKAYALLDEWIEEFDDAGINNADL